MVYNANDTEIINRLNSHSYEQIGALTWFRQRHDPWKLSSTWAQWAGERSKTVLTYRIQNCAKNKQSRTGALSIDS